MVLGSPMASPTKDGQIFEQLHYTVMADNFLGMFSFSKTKDSLDVKTDRGMLEVMLALRECGLVPYTSMAKVWLRPPSKPGEHATVRLVADTLYSEQLVGASGLARTSKHIKNVVRWHCVA